MPQTCKICRHDKRSEIDEALLNSEPLRNIAERTGTSATALFRHKKEHIARVLASTKQAAEEVSAETLFDRLRAINCVFRGKSSTDSDRSHPPVPNRSHPLIPIESIQRFRRESIHYLDLVGMTG